MKKKKKKNISFALFYCLTRSITAYNNLTGRSETRLVKGSNVIWINSHLSVQAHSLYGCHIFPRSDYGAVYYWNVGGWCLLNRGKRNLLHYTSVSLDCPTQTPNELSKCITSLALSHVFSQEHSKLPNRFFFAPSKLCFQVPHRNRYICLENILFLSSSHIELAIKLCSDLIFLEFSLRIWSWQKQLLCKQYPPDVKCILEINKECISISVARTFKIIYVISF